MRLEKFDFVKGMKGEKWTDGNDFLSRNLKPIAIYAGVGALLVGASLYESSGPTEERCLTYQGHRAVSMNDAKDTNIAVFDDKILAERTGAPYLTATYTSPEKIKGLKEKEKYLVEYQEQKFGGLPKLLSISSCD